MKKLAKSLILVIFLMSGCEKEKESTERTVIFSVSPTLFTENDFLNPDRCVYFMELTDEKTKENMRLLVGVGTEAGIEEKIEPIEGFKFEEGYIFKIKVLITKEERLLYSLPGVTYKLIEILSKVKVEN